MLDIDTMHHFATNMDFVLGVSSPDQWGDNAADKAKSWGGKFLTILGVILIFVGAWNIFMACVSKSSRGKHVVVGISCFAVGVAFTVGGFSYLKSIGDAGYSGFKGVTGS